MASSAKAPSPRLPGGIDPSVILDRARLSGQNAELLDYVQVGVRKKSRRRNALLGKGAGTLALVVLLLWAVPYFRDTSSVVTPLAERQAITLADGTDADLNAHTEMTTDFRYGRRVIQLKRGEAYFSVAKDPAHPFLVETPAGTVRVTGTRFNVRVAGDGATEVTLVEGSVVFNVEEASPPHSPGARGADASLAAAEHREDGSTLRPGQELTSVNDTTIVHTLSPAQLAAAVAWRQGQIILDGLTIAQAASRMADFHGCKIAVSPSVANIRLGGSSLPLNDLPQFIRTLAAVGGIQVIHNDDDSYVVSGR